MKSDPRTANTPIVEEVANGVFAYVQPDGTWWVNTTGFLTAGSGVIAIDACATESRTRRLVDTIGTITDTPITTVVNTHHHGDHTFGNFVFGDVTITAHERARAAALAWGPPRAEPFWTDVDWGAFELRLPTLTFSSGVTLWANERVEVRYVGTPAHTDNDSIVWLPEQRVLFAGDLAFVGGTPFFMQGSVVGTIKALRETVIPLGARVVVPGHGPVTGPEIFEEMLSYAEFVYASAQEAHSTGLRPLDAARELDLGVFAEWHDSERIVGNLHRAYAEIEGNAPGVPLRYDEILGDMVTYNGGPLMTCA